MALLGRAALLIAFALATYAALGGGYAAWRGRRRLLESARSALVASLAATVVASLVLLGALAANDFSLLYVADLTSRELPLAYTLAAFWGGQEGSLLLWLLVLLTMGTGAVALNPRLTRDVLPWTVPIIAGVASFFAFLLVFVASPFVTGPAPADGAGLNPSLQNPYMLAHPPLLYLGYVGLTIPFAFAMAALASRRNDERWIVATRRWTLTAWMFLGVAILLGAKWAYEEVGWGGWYAWDPVENAALMPWLVATAFLHSVLMQEKKDILRLWNAVLVTFAFSLSLFGTFLTRSGILSSIHSFTQSSIGPWFLGFIALVAGASIALILARLDLLRSRTRLESLVSREAAFLYNNLFLVALALTVLWGVLYPILSEAVRGVTVTVGAPYYDFFAIVFGLPVVLLMGIGPLVAWRRASLRSLATSVAWPATAAVAVGAVLLALGAGSSLVGLVGYTFGAFVLAAIVLEFARGTRTRKALGDATWVSAFATLVGRNRRRYGGYVVHAAIVLLLVGAVGIGAFSTSREARLRPGESVEVAGYTLRLLGSEQRRAANAQ
ncbi:MAG: cytochrome c biogenesis protein CcsA, partial [Actinomycetota bacterium]|nr:cytochrome c biogenesis protein CcsA [Actinomycetota bacterium]